MPVANRPLLSYQLELLENSDFSSVLVVSTESYFTQVGWVLLLLCS